jgi:hypothetical protein
MNKSIEKTFNTVGPCQEDKHYLLEPLSILPVKFLDRFLGAEGDWEKELAYDTLQFVSDQAMVKLQQGFCQAANPIYGSLIVWCFTLYHRVRIPKELLEYCWVDGEKLTLTALLRQFQHYWKNEPGSYRRKLNFDSMFGPMVLCTFLHCILTKKMQNIKTVFGFSRLCLDVTAIFQEQSYPVVMKEKSKNMQWSEIANEGFAQLRPKMDSCRVKEGWLVIFDKTQDADLKKPQSWETRRFEGVTVQVVRC